MTHRGSKSSPPSTPAVDHAPELAALKTQVAELTLGWQRTQADFDNFRRRALADQGARTANEVGRALVPLTSVAENLRRALEQHTSMKTPSVEQLEAWAKGVASISRQFDHALAAAGLTPIHPAAGDPFDPNHHEALAHQPHNDHGADTVTQVVERGYKVGNHVLVPAKVIVSSGTSL